MKNSIKALCAALALSAVASTAVATSAFAADFTLPDGKVITEAEIAAATNKAVIKVESKEIKLSQVPTDRIVPITISISGANQAYCATGLHLAYDSALTIGKNPIGGLDCEYGAAVKYISTNPAEPDQTGKSEVFFSTAGSADNGLDGEYVTINFVLPEDLEGGEVFKLDLNYQDNDLFLDGKKTDAGYAMMAYAFQNMVDGAITIVDDSAPVTEATTTTTAAPVSTGEVETTAATKTSTVAPTSTTGKAATTTAKGNSPKTGVAGVGVAAAGLVAAAGAAFVLRKKED